MWWRSRWYFALALALSQPVVACSSGAQNTNHGFGGGGGGLESSAADQACMPAGLAASQRVSPWQLPRGCQRTSTDPATPTLVHREEEFRAAFNCQGAAGSGIDFGASMLVISDRSASPAYSGGEIRDDGHRVTFVTRYRTPQEGEPLPMPMSITYTFLLPANATRTFADASCTIDG